MVAVVVEIRGLSESVPIATRVVDEKTFGALFVTKTTRELGGKDRAPPSTLQSEHYLGFYDEFSKTIVLRDHLPAWTGASEVEAISEQLLAHEVVHALQDQHFGIRDFARFGSDDQRLASQALYEGDAQLVQIAYSAKRLHLSWKRAALNAHRQGAVSPDALARIGGFSPSLLSLPIPQREAMAFPYLAGTAFVSALYRAGGFVLVDRAFSHLPNSTAQVLEPERYLAGIQPAVFHDLPIPEGSRGAPQRTLGALGLRSLLASFPSPLPPTQTRKAVEGWNGDRLAWFQTQGGEVGMLLSIEWSSAEQASRFQAVARRALVSDDSSAARDTDAWAVVGSGTSVAVVHAPGAARIAPTLLNVARLPPPPKPPLGSVTLPPAPVPLTDRQDLRGTTTASHFESRWLSLRAAIPAGFVADTTRPELQLVIKRQSPPGNVGVFSVQAVQQSISTAQIHREYIEELVEATPKASRPVEISSGEAKTPFGLGTQVTWRFSVGQLTFGVRSLRVGVCAGNVVLQWYAIWSDDEDGHALESWMQSFESIMVGPSPACGDIRAENAEDPQED